MRWIALAAALVWAPTAASAATVTVGAPLPQSFAPRELNGVGTAFNALLPEPGALVTSPIDGTVVRWRVSGAAGGPFRLRILRPAGPETFTGVGTSAPASPAGFGVEEFATALPIKAGDFIGFDNNKEGDQIGVVDSLPGALALAWIPPLPDGLSRPADESSSGTEVALNADVQPLPKLFSVSPNAGSFKGNTTVTIAGSDLTGATSVSFGATAATSFTVDSDTQITATAPPATAPGIVDVVVTTLAGTTATGAADQFSYRACIVPAVVGKTLKKARKRLRKAGCRAGKVRMTAGTAKATVRVVKQKPKAGKLRAPDTKVKLTLG